MLINIIIAFAAASVLSFLAMWYPWPGDGDGAIVLALVLSLLFAVCTVALAVGRAAMWLISGS